MRPSRPARRFLRLLLVSALVYLLRLTCAGAGPDRKAPSSRRASSRRTAPGCSAGGAAEPDGRPKQHRKFGSNTVRLLKPSASSVSYLPASPDHQYHFSVQYHLDTLPSEQLVRASFVHLRSAPAPFNSSQGAPPPRCRARVAPLGRESLVVLEPHQRWTETDITAHLQTQRRHAQEPLQAALLPPVLRRAGLGALLHRPAGVQPPLLPGQLPAGAPLRLPLAQPRHHTDGHQRPGRGRRAAALLRAVQVHAHERAGGAQEEGGVQGAGGHGGRVVHVSLSWPGRDASGE
ncbi:unnamed protein product [Tetraodon nigroviridis]|uniref:Chromosome undetermined SCAF12261, whole genome shotgun sequence n=1 Tax=Tetraodon nigroviridis TaxID=99883 RepID=Q4SXZ8_TETNG|nr:unnamed protein product [Tetraodon nigroviridis]